MQLSRGLPAPARARRSTAAVLLAAALVGQTAAPTALAAPAEVPAATPTTSVVTVRTGGDRTGDAAVGPLAGVRLGLFTDAAGTTPVTADPWGECVSDADGDCAFVIPDTGTGGSRRDDVYHVKQIDAPPGWYTNPELRTGHGSGADSAATAYVFPTPALQGGEVYRSTGDFMFDLTVREPLASSGVWQQSRNNPVLPDRCGLDVAVVLDLSASVGSALPDLKQAADRFTDALVGTPSRMALFTFDRRSPSTGTANHPELMSVSSQAGADAFKELYADWTLGSGTNWDQGLWKVARAEQRYDLVVVLTDGNPTYFADLTGDGANTRVAEVEGGVFSANAVKARGSRVVALGVGSGVEGVTALNLRALSGPTAYDGANATTADYFQTTDYAAAGEALHRLVIQQCAGSVSVTKMLVPSENLGEDVTGAEPAGAGWRFDAATTTGGATVTPSSATTTDDGTGTVVFDLGGDADITDLQVTEGQHDGHTLVQQGGVNAVCAEVGTGASVTAENVGETGFGLPVPQGAALTCTVYNKPVGTADVTVSKLWSIDGEVYADGEQPAGFTARATLTGPGSLPASVQGWDDPRDGYTVGDEVTVDETVTVPEACAVVSRQITLIDGADSEEDLPHTASVLRDDTTFRITNTVDCPETGAVVVDKQWVIDGAHYADGHQPGGFGAQLTLTGPGDAAATDQAWDVPRPGYPVGGSVTIAETVAPFDDQSCALVSSRLTAAQGTPVDLPLPHTATVTGLTAAFVVTNTVDCGDAPDLGVSKESDRREAAPGQTVTYTVTITNSGTTATPDAGATFRDDLTEVLRHAAYNNDATASSGTLTYDEPVLSWSGPLGPGESATVRYSVTVDPDAPDRAKLCNTVTAPGADCPDTACVMVTTRGRPGKPGKPHGKPWQQGKPRAPEAAAWGRPWDYGKPWTRDGRGR
ncbi:DUF11 domain-containing protein [Actinocorallia sp. API 0066]|uniref:DUF7927 domain-containing protein n=1 Tax=Actinocorallia sp. API 0066 TaxID=2896846 RepID=UPI001E2AF0AE|nr:CARDB domain-containing protein [Actinocorallia sp. API 0066]MCD0449967.1 DUF11 domain-containing protein [Actinocorallia sp. API 0066]